MKRHWMGVLALAGWITIAAMPQSASAQRASRNMHQPRGPANGSAAVSPGPVEQLPPGQPGPRAVRQGDFSDPFADEHFGPHEFFPDGGYHHGYISGGGPAYGDSGHGSWYHGGQFFVTADYLYVRARFSEALALIEQIDQGNMTAGDWEQFDFGYDSSYRLGGGYRLCGCGDEVRFLYTRLTSDAEEQAVFGDIVPFEAQAPPNGLSELSANVEVNTYDLEFVKRIPLGGSKPCGCGDPCCGDGCGSTCGASCCPSWDVSWSGGVRFAEVDWERSYTAFTDTGFAVTDAGSAMSFRGAGVRMGLEGRRYFFTSGWLSVFMKGDISLLLGDVEIDTFRATDQQATVTSPDTLDTQSFENRQIIPVTEIETGVTAQITCHTRLSAGYLFSAWHDLGFRDEPQIEGAFFEPPTSYDDANILGFDGFFARVEWSY